MGIFGIAPGRHSARSAFRPRVVGIQPLLGSFHWSAFRRSAFGHAPMFSIDICVNVMFVLYLHTIDIWEFRRTFGRPRPHVWWVSAWWNWRYLPTFIYSLIETRASIWCLIYTQHTSVLYSTVSQTVVMKLNANSGCAQLHNQKSNRSDQSERNTPRS